MTGEIKTAQLFVATLGASSYTYAEATWTQNLADWIGSHRRAFSFFGGVSAMVVCDNLKSGITKACFYEPAVNRSYAEMAAHYGTSIVPARPYKPRDKERTFIVSDKRSLKVEVAVLLTTRWIIAKLRNRRFFSLAALNDAIRDCVVVLNDRVSRHLGASRRALFETLEHPALKALPAEPYVYAEWKECRGKRTFIVSGKRSLGLDYHVEIEKHYYSTGANVYRERQALTQAGDGRRQGTSGLLPAMTGRGTVQNRQASPTLTPLGPSERLSLTINVRERRACHYLAGRLFRRRAMRWLHRLQIAGEPGA